MSTTAMTHENTDSMPGGLDEQLKAAALTDLPLRCEESTAVAGPAAPHVAGPTCTVLPSGEQEQLVTDRAAAAVERIVGARPRNQMHVRSMLRRWAVLRATAGTVPTR